MQDIQIDGVKENTNILALGSLFRPVNGSQWGVNVLLWPTQEKRSLRVSQFPVVVRRRVLNPTVPPKSSGYLRNIRIDNTMNWLICRVVDCPARNHRITQHEARQPCFYFRTRDGLDVYIPQNELARALFLHDAYLSRAAMEPNSLNIDFDVQYSNARHDSAIINVLGVSNYASKSLDYIANRRILSWILLDPDARASFNSISRYQMNDSIEIKGYRHWYFQFDPPPLTGVELGLKGQFNEATNSIFVWEITAVRNITHKVPEKVEFYSPKFEENVRGNGERTISHPPIDRSQQHHVKDGAEANSDTKPIVLHAPSVGVSFLKPFETIKVCKKKRVGAVGRKDDEVASTNGKRVSTEEGDATGNTPRADWDTLNDQSDDTHHYANKFSCFADMLKQLVVKHGCAVIRKEIRKLPRVGRSERHLLKNEGLPRCMAVVEIRCGDRLFHILEVDTSDAANSIATKLLLIHDNQQWDHQLVQLERKLIKASLNWPRQYLDDICGQTGHGSIPHPKTSSEHKGQLEPESIDKWAERVKGWMSQE